MFAEKLRRDKKATFLPLLLSVMEHLLSSGLKEFSDPIRLYEIPQNLGVNQGKALVLFSWCVPKGRRISK